MKNSELLDRLEEEQTLSKEEWISLIDKRTPELSAELNRRAAAVAVKWYGRNIFLRGLIEFTNYCRNNCLYCGIRKDNENVHRYRLTKEEILDCCRAGYLLDFRTFVLQGGEDGYFLDALTASRILLPPSGPNFRTAPSRFRSENFRKEDYQKLFDAGADRYLLRHETYDNDHYRKLHPPELSPEHRRQCLRELKEIGYQVGTGMMVGSPYQTTEILRMICCS
jgi:biotin synthase